MIIQCPCCKKDLELHITNDVRVSEANVKYFSLSPTYIKSRGYWAMFTNGTMWRDMPNVLFKEFSSEKKCLDYFRNYFKGRDQYVHDLDPDELKLFGTTSGILVRTENK